MDLPASKSLRPAPYKKTGTLIVRSRLFYDERYYKHISYSAIFVFIPRATWKATLQATPEALFLF
jgi:hypothetical protein